ncbi:serine/threonine protein kinase [Phormidium sp. CCY1219]|uniref:serine/threonine protein kinase n=1 Tax=Phormidium sp. CCY1219 TaxID=2886104 RepID=UPI002D1EA52B|nr:serine/threonine-protein kinase [Phormidium sp. CCY1219]MEB3826482.1 serine/threonine protein kinase [Phormidium sp. CCY1219]
MESLHHPKDILKDRYRITHTLGRGGIGITYAAEDLQTGKSVAIKTLSLRQTQDWKVIELFEREAKVLSHLQHPAIPDYLDYFNIDTPDDRRFYIVQELAEGQSLEEAIASGWHPTEIESRDIAKQVLAILNYLHELNPPVIHRDIKPQNIILHSNGRILLVDFGAVQDTYRHTMTSGSTVVGTYGYMAPEQFRGQAQPSTDLYGLGATLIYLLTHQSPAELPEKRLKLDFRPYVNVSNDFADWLEQMLEPAVEDRFTSAVEALGVLDGNRESIYPLKSSSRKPAGSRISLNKTKRKLVVDMPPTGFKPDSIGLIFFALFWNGFLVLWTSGAAMASIFFAMFSIPFWVVGLTLTGTLLFQFFGRTRLEIDRETFRLQWQLFGFTRKIEGNVEDIYRAEVSPSNVKINSRPVVSCALQVGVKTYRFGSNFTIVEQEWLVSEVASFIGKPSLMSHR